MNNIYCIKMRKIQHFVASHERLKASIWIFIAFWVSPINWSKFSSSSSFAFIFLWVGCKKYVVEGNFHVGFQLSFVSWISYEKCMMILRMQIIIFYLCLQNIYLYLYMCVHTYVKYWGRKFMRPYVASTLKIHVKKFLLFNILYRNMKSFIFCSSTPSVPSQFVSLCAHTLEAFLCAIW